MRTKLANTGVNVANLAIDSSDAYQVLQNPEADTLTKVMTFAALAGDIGGIGLDYKTGQFGLSAPKTNLPDVPKVNNADDLARVLNSEDLCGKGRDASAAEAPRVDGLQQNGIMDESIPTTPLSVRIREGAADLVDETRAFLPI